MVSPLITRTTWTWLVGWGLRLGRRGRCLLESLKHVGLGGERLPSKGSSVAVIASALTVVVTAVSVEAASVGRCGNVEEGWQKQQTRNADA